MNVMLNMDFSERTAHLLEKYLEAERLRDLFYKEDIKSHHLYTWLTERFHDEMCDILEQFKDSKANDLSEERKRRLVKGATVRLVAKEQDVFHWSVVPAGQYTLDQIQNGVVAIIFVVDSCGNTVRYAVMFRTLQVLDEATGLWV